jgi:hypothetical protein
MLENGGSVRETVINSHLALLGVNQPKILIIATKLKHFDLNMKLGIISVRRCQLIKN